MYAPTEPRFPRPPGSLRPLLPPLSLPARTAKSRAALRGRSPASVSHSSAAPARNESERRTGSAGERPRLPHSALPRRAARCLPACSVTAQRALPGLHLGARTARLGVGACNPTAAFAEKTESPFDSHSWPELRNSVSLFTSSRIKT